MLGIFQKFDQTLYDDLIKKNELEMYDFLVQHNDEVSKKKSKTVYKVMKQKKWTIPYLMDCAVNRALLQSAKATNAEIIHI